MSKHSTTKGSLSCNESLYEQADDIHFLPIFQLLQFFVFIYNSVFDVRTTPMPLIRSAFDNRKREHLWGTPKLLSRVAVGELDESSEHLSTLTRWRVPSSW